MVTLTKEVPERQAQSLDRAKNGKSTANYLAILAGFSAMGILESDIKPRNNVFTYQAWRAQGRQVRKGVHGVRISTFVPITIKDKKHPNDRSKDKTASKPRQTTVFHFSQTDERGAK